MHSPSRPSRRSSRIFFPLATALLILLPGSARAQRGGGTPAEIPTIEQLTAGMQRMEGFFDIYWDEGTGNLYWEIDRWDSEFLYQVSLSTGLGSNPVGLDRGQLGSTYVVKFHRVGPAILLIEPNYRYRARSQNPNERRAVEEAFAPSTLWGFQAAARTGDRILVDATDFFLRDTHGAASTMQRAGQGSFRLDRSRSVFYLDRTRAFPKNTEVETQLTFTSENAGGQVRSTAASGEAVTLREHHSLVELPDAGYEPREADPRVSAFATTFYDYATPIDQEMVIHWVNRHRLQKKNPRAARSEAVEPIVYYVDNGAPEPIRSALVEGASWWNQAFEAAGFTDAFQVKVLPDGADPMDLRYNVIHWTHRSTRGWSYGGSVSDPRTGEILKGNVNLGSLRLRQDILLGRGVIPAFAGGAGGGPVDQSISGCLMAEAADFDYLATVAQGGDAAEMALARVRQLSAHEVGHTLGFAHNYIASTYDRGSVMDYPAPVVEITRTGALDLSNAYAVGIGSYDKFAVTWLYSDFAPGADERQELGRIVQVGLDRGMRFISDNDARPLGAAHPYTALWDNGADPVDYLQHEYQVRRIGMEAFGASNIREGAPMASLEEVFVPLYLHHRYQLEAAMHSLGGADYTYALRGDGQVPITIVAPAKQRQALDLGLRSLDPDFLAVPERVLQMIPPRAFGMTTGEIFSKQTSPTFDPIGVARTAADMTVSMILQPQRMARLVEFNSRDARYPGLDEVVGQLLEVTWYADAPSDAYRARIQDAVRSVVLEQMKSQAGSAGCTPEVRAVLDARLHELHDRLSADGDAGAVARMAVEDLERWFARPEGLTAPSRVPEAPPGMPIGTTPPPPPGPAGSPLAGN